MDQIELWNGSSKAIISIDGAWLTNLSDQNGQILFPKRTLQAPDGSQKIRGGAHVCLPNFGPGGLSDQPQHGYGRTALWQVMQQTQSSVTLELPNGPDEYDSVSSTVFYLLDEGCMSIVIKMTNNGPSGSRVSPGIHPYFSITDDENAVVVNDQTYYVDELAGTEFIHADKAKVRLARRTITLSSADMMTWAVWTDLLGGYVCVEPTRDGNSFENNDDPVDDEILAPGQSRRYAVKIQW